MLQTYYQKLLVLDTSGMDMLGMLNILNNVRNSMRTYKGILLQGPSKCIEREGSLERAIKQKVTNGTFLVELCTD